MSESFFLSNMAPQVGVGFNRGIWMQLESAIRGWVRQRGPLTVITGPVFDVAGDTVTYRVIGADHVAVPTAFYKIVADYDSPTDVAVLAFILPNEALIDRDIAEFLVSVDDVEARTGLDFLAGLDDQVENALESVVPDRIW